MHFNLNDVLIHISQENKKLLFSNELLFDSNEFPPSILRDAKKYMKEAGVNTLARTVGQVELVIEGKKVLTPVIIQPLTVRADKLKQEISCLLQDEEWFVNPFLLNYISHFLKKNVPELLDIPSVFSFLNDLGFENINSGVVVIGNFHHHRFQIIKELEELKGCDDVQPNLQTLLGKTNPLNTVPFRLSPLRLLPADIDHEIVFKSLETQNCVVQGPPGTGKSQVLTNVLANNLLNDATTIVISEKRVALEVLVKKLSAFQLDKLCFIASSNQLSHSFLQGLKDTWDYFDNYSVDSEVILGLSKQVEDNLQMSLDILRQENLIGGISFSDFHALVENFKGWDKVQYISQVPDVFSVLGKEDVIEEIYAKGLNESLAFLRPEILQSEGILNLDMKIKNWLNQLQLIKKELSFSTYDELRKVMHLAVDCQVYENEMYKKHASLFKPNSRAQKRFFALRKKYFKLQKEIEIINDNQSHWKIIPSGIEAKYLLDVFQSGTFFNRLKVKNRWKKLSSIAVEKAPEVLVQFLQENEKKSQFSKILVDFCDLNIGNPETEVNSIYQTLVQFNTEKWQELEKIPIENRIKLTENHQLIQNLHADFRHYFLWDDSVNIQYYLEDLLACLDKILSIKNRLNFIDSKILNVMKTTSSKDAFFHTVLKSNWVKFKEKHPILSDFKMSELKQKVSEVMLQEKIESAQLVKEIDNRIKKKFDDYHTLLQTPARKLSEEDKKKKTILRKGKSILIKEFSKTRSHPSLRELYNSEARIWIQLLKPIWLSNPTQLGKCFPMEKELFDLAIFDEASQIPLQNALGSIQRSKQVLIAGDEHQMGPTTYFKRGDGEVIDLLHQANYHFSKVVLQHHYRSAHPDLISFSNQHFYENKLKVFPMFHSLQPLHHHFVEGAHFVDRKNTVEAKRVAEKIEELLNSNDSIGVVAFSEEQLNCVWKELSDKSQNRLQDLLENNRGFFKSLENVQGDECDHLIISFGYGKDENEEFHMRFGPMNQVNGRKRLNVLLTRAKHSIHFYCSVKSSEFKRTDNESVQLLKKWVHFSENYRFRNTIQFPFDIKPEVMENKLIVKNVHDFISEAREIVTFQRVLEERGWELTFN